MTGKPYTLGLVLILSALIVSGCATPTAEPVGPSTGEGEYCVDKATDAKMSYEEAVEIARNSECAAQGGLKETRFCNEDTGTWWIDLDIEKPGFSYARRRAVVSSYRDTAVDPVYLMPLDPAVTVIGPGGGTARSSDGKVIAVFPEGYDQQTRQALVARIPLGRPGSPEDVASTVRFLAEHGDYITGQIIPVDGGRSLV